MNQAICNVFPMLLEKTLKNPKKRLELGKIRLKKNRSIEDGTGKYALQIICLWWCNVTVMADYDLLWAQCCWWCVSIDIMEVSADDVRLLSDETAGIWHAHKPTPSILSRTTPIQTSCSTSQSTTITTSPNHHQHPLEVRSYTCLSSFYIIVVLCFCSCYVVVIVITIYCYVLWLFFGGIE